MRHHLIQAGLVTCSAAAIALIIHGYMLLGCSIGLLGQVFWFTSAWRARQWGVLLLTWWFVFNYSYGIIAELTR